MTDRLLHFFAENNIDLNAREIAEIFWLSQYIETRQSEDSERNVESSTARNLESSSSDSTSVHELDSQNDLQHKKNSKIENEVNISSKIESEKREGLPPHPIKGPSPQLIRNKGEFQRALYPLLQKIESSKYFIFDEEKTAHKIADTNIFQVVESPSLERWLEIDIVIDNTPSMEYWRWLIKELESLLRCTGAFRSIHFWRIDFDDHTGQPFLISGRQFSKSSKGRQHSLREITNFSGKRAIIWVSDCSSPAWYNGQYSSVFDCWGKKSLLSIFQVLPYRLWYRTGLQFLEEVILQAKKRVRRNIDFVACQENILSDEIGKRTIGIPILCLDPDTFRQWADTISGRYNEGTLGVLVQQDTPSMFSLVSEDVYEEPIDGVTLVKRFFESSSKEAWQLAVYFSLLPSINIPLMRLIQESLVQDSRFEHLAEVLLGGILRPVQGEQGDLDWTFEFKNGVQEELSESLPKGKAVEILSTLSEYVGEHLDSSTDFLVYIGHLALSGDTILGVVGEGFAKVSTKILKKYGGKLAEIAEKVDQYSSEQVEKDNIRIRSEEDFEDEEKLDVFEEFIDEIESRILLSPSGHYQRNNTGERLSIFLSCANEDRSLVQELYKRLLVANFVPWVSFEDILPGEDWGLAIEKSLNRSDVILLCLSEAAISNEGFLQREFKRVTRFQEQKPEGTIFTIPIRLDNCRLPESIQNLQHLDFPDQYERLFEVLNLRAEALGKIQAHDVNLLASASSFVTIGDGNRIIVKDSSQTENGISTGVVDNDKQIENLKVYNIVLASPSDVFSERKQVMTWVDELNAEFAENKIPYRLEIKSLTQGNVLINRSVQKQVDINDVHIFFGLLWQRFGLSPDILSPEDGKPFLSGSEEEIQRFFDAQNENEIGLPMLCFFWKQDLYLPEQVTEEYIQQYKKVIVFSQNCKSNGDHPAIVIPFKSGELEKKVKDELRSMAEKIYSGSGTFEAGLTSWLKLAWLRKHPFDCYVAEDDLLGTIENFYADNFNIKELRIDQRVHLIVGNKGSGKTALAEYLMSKCYPKNVSSKIYTFYWGKKQFSKLLAVTSLKSLTPILYAREIVQKIIDDIDNRGLNVAQLLEVREKTSYFEALPLFTALISLLRELGYSKLIVCFDQVDEIPGIGREPEKLIQIIEPLLQVVEQVNCEDLGFRIFLPDNLLDELIKREFVHFDHMVIDRLEWEETDIQLMLSRRLQSASASHRSPVQSLGQLAQIKNLDRRLIKLANRNPRSAIWLARALINQHCKTNPTVLQFSDQDWWAVQRDWFRSEEISGNKRNKNIGFHMSAFGRIFYYDQEVGIRGTRAEILRFLILRKGDICTDEEIAKVIYPEADPATVSDRVVPEAIRHLKEDLGEFGLEKHIERVRGKGFILLDDLEE